MLDEYQKRNIRESLVYALGQVSNYTQQRLVIQEFYASLNRKQFIFIYETEEETEKALKQLKEIEDVKNG